MRAAVITKTNSPWELKNLPDPEPKGGQVLIKIEASGMCGTDVHVHQGHLPCPLPIVAGHEPVGRIVALGAGVTHLKVGDRVGVHWVQRGCGRCPQCQAGRTKYCPGQQTWMHLGGGNSELMLAWEEGCTLVPDGVSSAEAAPIFCAGFTVMSGLRSADPRPGERVAVLGVGGLGHLALQFAKALGLETVAVTGSENKKEEAKSLGADHVVVVKDDLGKALQKMGGVDVVLCTTNSAAHVGQAIGGLRPEGRLVNMGLIDEIKFPAPALMFSQTRVIGSIQNNRSDLLEALDLLAQKKVKPMLEEYPISKINEVRERLEQGKVRYRAVMNFA